jgi:hypothetical protein
MPTKANSTAWATRGYGIADVALDSRVTHGLGMLPFSKPFLSVKWDHMGSSSTKSI